MTYKSLFLSLFILLFVYMTDQVFNFSGANSIYLLLAFLPIIAMLIIPSVSAKVKKKKLMDERSHITTTLADEAIETGQEFHNDFSRVGSADDPTPPKPIDLSGDAIKHARETLNEDLKKLEK